MLATDWKQCRGSFWPVGLQDGEFVTVLERRSSCGLSWEMSGFRFWIFLELVVVGLVLSDKVVKPCFMVRTTPKKVSGNLQVSNTTPGVMAKLFPYTCLPWAWGFACSPKHPIVRAPRAPSGKNSLLSTDPACQLGLIFCLPIPMLFTIYGFKMLFKSIPCSGLFWYN